MYQVSKYFRSQTSASVWNEIIKNLAGKPSIKSILGVEYKLLAVNEHEIKYQVSSRNGGKPETIQRSELDVVFKRLSLLIDFNTDSAKEIFKGARTYRKRSPVFAILLDSGCIEKI